MNETTDPLRQEYFDHEHVTEISAAVRPLRSDLREVWAYRDLLALLVQRDVTIRYKQSVIGITWTLLQPMVLTAIFTVVFGYFAKLPSDGYPYPAFALCALLPWLYFARSLTGTSDSLVGSAHLITKVYFPRLVLPLSRTMSGLVDFAVALFVLAAVLAWYRISPGWGLLLLPGFVAIAMLTAFGAGLWLTALNVKYRDIGVLVPFLVQIWMYASPIAYSTSLVPERWLWLYSLNPMVGVVDGFRWALLGRPPPQVGPMLLSVLIVVLLFAGGLAFFRRTERNFADLI